MKKIFLALISSLLCFSLVCVLSSCQERKLDLTQDFHKFYNMPNDQMAFNSGFNARLFSIKQEKANKPKIIINMCAIYDDADSFYQTTYDWFCVETETKKDDLHKIGECFDSFARSKNIDNYYLYLVFNTAYGQDIYDYQTNELTSFGKSNSFKINDDGKFVNLNEDVSIKNNNLFEFNETTKNYIDNDELCKKLNIFFNTFYIHYQDEVENKQIKTQSNFLDVLGDDINDLVFAELRKDHTNNASNEIFSIFMSIRVDHAEEALIRADFFSDAGYVEGLSEKYTTNIDKYFDTLKNKYFK